MPSKAGLKKEPAKPTNISPKENLSGISIVFISITERTIVLNKVISTKGNHQFMPVFHTKSTVRQPVINSTKGYWKEIFDLQLRHLPPKTKKLNTGILSYHLILLLQLKQCDAGHTTEILAGILYMQTFKKLPITIPKTKERIKINISGGILSPKYSKIPDND